MGRTVVRRVEQPRGRKSTDLLIVAGAAAILLFAVVGVISAGAFVANKVSGVSNKTTPKAGSHTSSASASVRDIARAQAQATEIIREAQRAGQRIIVSANTRARQHSAVASRRSHHVATARRPVAAVPTATLVPVAPAPAAPAPQPAAPVVPTTAPFAASPATGNVGARGSIAGSAGNTSSSVPNLSGVPASWLVVGYNATFGSGPGSAGGISVVNRGGKMFTGVAEVHYANGKVASAPFSGLAPGQSLVLPLDGPAYTGGGYHIVVSVH